MHNLDLAGGQIACGLVKSWLTKCRDPRFRIDYSKPPVYSDDGFDELAADHCDLACTDRPMEPRELAAFADDNVAGRRIAFYGYALYVHPDNPLDSIFAGHIDDLYQQRFTDWKQLGAGEGPIRLIGPPKGTRGGQLLARQAGIFLREPTWEVKPTEAEVIQAVADDQNALGFASIGLDNGVRYLGIRMRRRGTPAFPSIEEIEANKYGYAKVIYVYYRTPASPAVQAAMDFLQSVRGEQVIVAADCWQVAPQRAPVVLPERAKLAEDAR